MKQTLVSVLLSIFTIVFLTGCKDGSSPAAPGALKANVMATHASPNAPDVDLYVDNVKVGQNLAFPDNTAYLSVDEGTRAVAVK